MARYGHLVPASPTAKPTPVASSPAGLANSANIANAPPEWGPPIPLGVTKCREFPIERLPAWLGEFGHGLAESTQTPVDMAGAMLLAALSVALAKTAEVEPAPGWREPLVLWVLVALGPAHRKSAVVRAVSDPLFRWEAEEAERLRPTIDAARTTFDILQKRRLRLVAEAANCSADEAQGLMEELKALDEEIAQAMPPSEPRLLADNITPESLTTLMTKHQGKIGVLSAEGDLFDIMAGVYTGGRTNLGVFLKGHAGDRHRVDRGNRPSEFLDRPALPMGFCVQPDVLHGLMRQK